MKIFGCGDIFVAKRLPKRLYEGFDGIRDLIYSHDVCFGNLETTVHFNEGYPSRFPGGGYAMASPECLKDLCSFGFNILNIANNHTLDYSHKGLEATIKHLRDAGLPYFGAGMNLAEASSPVYVECWDGRAAFIGVTSSFHDSDAAGQRGGVIAGRPGVNPLRRIEYYQVTDDLYRSLKTVAEQTGMNDGHNWSIANGYREDSSELFLREMRFLKGNSNRRITHPLREDLDRVVLSIKDASIQADCVVVSVHSHQMDGTDSRPASFVREFCHECIDAGAHIIFGHGSHELRGLEIYNGCPIFYGLGDFILHNEFQNAMPKEFCEKVGMDLGLYDYVGIAMDKRSNGQTRGLQSNPRAWESIGASIEFSDGKVRQVKVYPVSLGYHLGRTRRGWPVIDHSSGILDYYKSLSEEFGTNIRENGGMGSIAL